MKSGILHVKSGTGCELYNVYIAIGTHMRGVGAHMWGVYAGGRGQDGTQRTGMMRANRTGTGDGEGEVVGGGWWVGWWALQAHSSRSCPSDSRRLGERDRPRRGGSPID